MIVSQSQCATLSAATYSWGARAMTEPATGDTEPGVSEDLPDEASSDRSLLRHLRDGRADASTRLYLRYFRRLNALTARQISKDISRRIDSEDIVQSVFRTFFRRAARGDFDIPEGQEIWGLLLVIALNKARDTRDREHAGKRDARKTSAGGAFDRAIESHPGRDDEALAQLRMVIDEVLLGLPDLNKRVVELRIEEYEVAEIAQQVQRSKRTVERILCDFRTTLGSLIKE
jgi:RNA polymerase sigma-70 factor, ECF subfamily